MYKLGERQNGENTFIVDGLEYNAFCDMKTDGGKWTVFQRRQDATVNFTRQWRDYKKGFGDVNGNFWLGLDIIHLLTKSGQHELRVDIIDAYNNAVYAKYEKFKVASESDAYRLHIGSYSGKYNKENMIKQQRRGPIRAQTILSLNNLGYGIIAVTFQAVSKVATLVIFSLSLVDFGRPFLYANYA